VTVGFTDNGTISSTVTSFMITPSEFLIWATASTAPLPKENAIMYPTGFFSDTFLSKSSLLNYFTER
jgi:hypothetical protein